MSDNKIDCRNKYLELNKEIEKHLHGAYYEMHSSKRAMVNEYYHEEDFKQDVRLKIFKHISQGKLDNDGKFKLSTMIKNLVLWHWIAKFSDNSDKAPVKRSQSLLAYTSTLVSDDEDDASNRLLESLQGVYNPEFEYNTDISRLRGHIMDVIPSKHHFVLEMLLGGVPAKTIGDKIGTSHQYVTKLARHYKQLLVDYLTKLGYNQVLLNNY